MKTVTSRDNPLLKSARKLRQTKGRGAAGAFIADGRKLIAEALDAGLVLESVFVSASSVAYGLASEDQAFLDMIQGLASPDKVIELGDQEYKELAGTETPQPFAAVFLKPGNVARGVGGSALVLDRIGDPGNAGAMIRTARAAGFSEVWTIKGTADLWSDKAIRAAAGSLFHMHVREGLSPEDVLAEAAKAGARVYALGMSGQDIYSTDLRGNIVLITGNEGSGVQEILLEKADAILAIPMAEGAESLNAAAAAAVALYEKHRQEKV